MTTLERLQRWYTRQCDGEWEHQFGVSIETCDNPGWLVKIQLADTALEETEFTPIAENVDAAEFQTDERWLTCRKVGTEWHGAGDETKLESILTNFLDWAERKQ